LSDLCEGIKADPRLGRCNIFVARFAARDHWSDKAGCLATVEVERELETP
jgi:hypothetical protein